MLVSQTTAFFRNNLALGEMSAAYVLRRDMIQLVENKRLFKQDIFQANEHKNFIDSFYFVICRVLACGTCIGLR